MIYDDERSLGPSTAEVNAAYDELRATFVDAVLAKNVDQFVPTPGSIAGHLDPLHIAFADECSANEFRAIIEILADVSNNHLDVATQSKASALIGKIASEYADSWAYDYASEK